MNVSYPKVFWHLTGPIFTWKRTPQLTVSLVFPFLPERDAEPEAGQWAASAVSGQQVTKCIWGISAALQQHRRGRYGKETEQHQAVPHHGWACWIYHSHVTFSRCYRKLNGIAKSFTILECKVKTFFAQHNSTWYANSILCCSCFVHAGKIRFMKFFMTKILFINASF